MLLNLLLPLIALGFGIILGSVILILTISKEIRNVVGTTGKTIRELVKVTDLLRDRISRIEKQIDKINNIK